MSSINSARSVGLLSSFITVRHALTFPLCRLSSSSATTSRRSSESPSTEGRYSASSLCRRPLINLSSLLLSLVASMTPVSPCRRAARLSSCEMAPDPTDPNTVFFCSLLYRLGWRGWGRGRRRKRKRKRKRKRRERWQRYVPVFSPVSPLV